jgi:hypothetical protein
VGRGFEAGYLTDTPSILSMLTESTYLRVNQLQAPLRNFTGPANVKPGYGPAKSMLISMANHYTPKVKSLLS